MLCLASAISSALWALNQASAQMGDLARSEIVELDPLRLELTLHSALC